jgi:Phosphotransferase system, mannose/fructose/N-acetylgalactosamine-specific component IID
MGENFLTTIHNSGMFRYLTYSITVIGTIMVGAMSAQHVRVATPMVFEFDGGNLVLQDTLDAIMRGILPLIVVMTCFYFLRKKVKITTVMLGVMAFAIFGAFIGLF